MYFKSFFIKLTFVILGATLITSCDRAAKPSAKTTDSLPSSAGMGDLAMRIEKDPSNAELYYERSQVYFNESYLDRALVDIQQAIDHDARNPLYYYFKGRVLYAMNRTLKASEAYEEAIKLKPDYAEAKLKVAELYYVVKEHQRSLSHLNSILASNPADAMALFYKGMNQKELKDTTGAIASFQSAYESDKKFYDAVMQLALLNGFRNPTLAAEYYAAAIRIEPKNEEAWFARGVLFENNKKYKDALLDYKKVVALNPSNDAAFYNVGYINFETKNYDRALDEWNTCIRINNNNIKAYYMRGLVHEIQKNKAEAKLNYEYALQLDPAFGLAKEGMKRVER